MKEEPTSPNVPPKSTLRPTSHILQRNKVDPDEEEPEQPPARPNSHNNKSATLSAKRLSLRIPNAFKNDSTVTSKKFGFTLGSNARKQRKQLDLSLFQTEQQQPTATNSSAMKQSIITTTPGLSDGSTLSDSSSICSSVHSQQTKSPSSLVKKPFGRRSSQVSFKSMDRRGSSSTLQHHLNNRPTTPSLLSNSSTIQSPVRQQNNSLPSQPAKSSWLNNLFFFKQPKICSLVVYSTHTAGILRSLHRLMNKVNRIKVDVSMLLIKDMIRPQKPDFMKSVIVLV